MQTYKDPMHAYDHGVAMHILTAIVKTIHKLEDDLHLPRNFILNKPTRISIQGPDWSLYLAVHVVQRKGPFNLARP